MIFQIIRGLLYACGVMGALWVLWSIMKSAKNQYKSENEEEIVYENKYFYLSQAILCTNCDCIFSRKDYKKCPSCGKEIEIFSTDRSARCGACGHIEDCRYQSCYLWCAYAKECEKAE